jgi:hypothetical protein
VYIIIDIMAERAVRVFAAKEAALAFELSSNGAGAFSLIATFS